jgi:hypothetical protein
MTFRLDDDPGQPHIPQIETCRLIGAGRSLASRAEQRASQDRRQKVIDARPRRSGRGIRFWSDRNGRAGGGASIVRPQFDYDHAAEEGAPGNEKNKKAVDHR